MNHVFPNQDYLQIKTALCIEVRMMFLLGPKSNDVFACYDDVMFMDCRESNYDSQCLISMVYDLIVVLPDDCVI